MAALSLTVRSFQCFLQEREPWAGQVRLTYAFPCQLISSEGTVPQEQSHCVRVCEKEHRDCGWHCPGSLRGGGPALGRALRAPGVSVITGPERFEPSHCQQGCFYEEEAGTFPVLPIGD